MAADSLESCRASLSANEHLLSCDDKFLVSELHQSDSPMNELRDLVSDFALNAGSIESLNRHTPQEMANSIAYATFKMQELVRSAGQDLKMQNFRSSQIRDASKPDTSACVKLKSLRHQNSSSIAASTLCAVEHQRTCRFFERSDMRKIEHSGTASLRSPIAATDQQLVLPDALLAGLSSNLAIANACFSSDAMASERRRYSALSRNQFVDRKLFTRFNRELTDTREVTILGILVYQ